MPIFELLIDARELGTPIVSFQVLECEKTAIRTRKRETRVARHSKFKTVSRSYQYLHNHNEIYVLLNRTNHE